MEILPKEKHCRISAHSYWTLKTTLPVNCLPKDYCFILYELLTSMLNSKLSHRKTFFSLFIGFGVKDPKPTSPFLSQKIIHDFKANLHMADFSIASSPEQYEIVFPENCITHN